MNEQRYYTIGSQDHRLHIVCPDCGQTYERWRENTHRLQHTLAGPEPA